MFPMLVESKEVKLHEKLLNGCKMGVVSPKANVEYDQKIPQTLRSHFQRIGNEDLWQFHQIYLYNSDE